MSRWTPDQSSLLSLLLDEVVGTQQMIDIRQDYCRLYDVHLDEDGIVVWKFSGSKAEGLDLPGSDEDFMFHINAYYNVKVVQTIQEVQESSSYSYNIFLMCTENVPPGFTLLQHLNPSPFSIRTLYPSLQNIIGREYWSSDIVVQCIKNYYDAKFSRSFTFKRQGPSIEAWGEFDKLHGTDWVPSIHCPFWPHSASEWTQRPRHFEWPSSHEVSSIVAFGFHLVPIGHPLSDSKLREWRISFSFAERALVWSFNHVQMQCYAVMKIILKEFIKVKCSTQNFVLCSYFIKTFLFWTYEATELHFWCPENFRLCIKFLLIEFSKCVREGILRHYFIPRFNLLSVKLRREAQAELLSIFDMAIQCDISVLRECQTLRSVWSTFLFAIENRRSVISNIERENLLNNDSCMMHNLDEIFFGTDLRNVRLDKYLPVFCKTQLKYLFLTRLLPFLRIKSIILPCSENKNVYQLHKFTVNDDLLIDISTVELWYAFFLLIKREYTSVLSIVNKMLSKITPFTLYNKNRDTSVQGSSETKELYKDMFLDSGQSLTQRVKAAWLFSFNVHEDMLHKLPLAIQVEFQFWHYEESDELLKFAQLPLSPYVCAYYLMFLCYHELRQYTERDRALDHLIEVAIDPFQHDPLPFVSLNIAGHCLLMAGKTREARIAFSFSRDLTNSCLGTPPNDYKCNSAPHYLHMIDTHTNVSADNLVI